MTWPASLPQKFDQGTFSERMPSGVVKAKTDIGPGKRRRRFTAVPRYLSGSMTLTPSQVSTFDTFYYTSTKAGADEFTWAHPLTENAINCVFDGEISRVDDEAGDVVVTFTVEVLP
nr:hypothetical protein 10 [Spirochaetaceae bacterium]